MNGLLLAFLIVVVYAAACWWKAYCLVRYDRERERQIGAYRAPCGEPLNDRGDRAA